MPQAAAAELSHRPTPGVGLVLGAGGVVGSAFHSGVLSALHEATGWDPRWATVIVGTSAGSITGTALRAGLSAAEIRDRAEHRPMTLASRRAEVRRSSVLEAGAGPRAVARELARALGRAAARPLSARPIALVAGLLPEGTIGTDAIRDGITELHPGPWPDQPLLVCSVRQRDGRLVAFGRDSWPPLGDAVAASCAIPGFFSPVVIEGTAYLDGGLHSPTNADVLTETGLALVLVSSPMSYAGRRPGLRSSPVRRWSRALLDAEARRLRRAGIHVVAFQPTPDDLEAMGRNAMDTERRSAVIEQARASTLRRLERADTRERLAPLLDL